MKNILTPEQSQRLIELGVENQLASEELIENVYQQEYNEPRPKIFTLTDLLSILPKKITDRRYIYTLEMGAWNTEDDGWYIKYVNDMDNDTLESYQEAEELIDAIYSMIVWLKDNEKLVYL